MTSIPHFTLELTRARLATLLVLAAGALLLMPAPPAHAGTYDVYSCDAAPMAPNTMGAGRADDAWRYLESNDWYGTFEGGKGCGSGASPSGNSNCWGQQGNHQDNASGWFFPGRCWQRPGDKTNSPGMTSSGGLWTRSVNSGWTPYSSGSMQVFSVPPNTFVEKFRVKDYLRREGCDYPGDACDDLWTVAWVGYTQDNALKPRGCYNGKMFCQMEGDSGWMWMTPDGQGYPNTYGNQTGTPYPSWSRVTRLQLNTTCGDNNGGCDAVYWNTQGHGYFTIVTIEDYTAPSVSINGYDGGSRSELASSKAIKPATHDLDYNVRDNVGVRRTQLLIDGWMWVAAKDYPCDYTNTTPCPTDMGVAVTGGTEKLEVNTGGLSTGWHSAIVYAWDAAGNVGASPVGYFYADNSPPAPVNCDPSAGPLSDDCANSDDTDSGDTPPCDSCLTTPPPTGGGVVTPPGEGAAVFTYDLLRNERPTSRPVRPRQDCKEVGPVPGPLSAHDARQVVTVNLDLRGYMKRKDAVAEQSLKSSFSLRSRLNREYLYAMGCSH